MTNNVARLGDVSDHGGVIITASTTDFANGIGKARLDDLHACPLLGHGVTPIVTSSHSVFVNGRGVARIGDVTGCGATIITGSPDVFADDIISIAPGVNAVVRGTSTGTPAGTPVLTPFYQNNPTGYAAQKKSELASMGPGGPAFHENAIPQPNEAPQPPVGCDQFHDPITDADMSRQVSTYFKLGDCRMTPVAQNGLLASDIACNWLNLCVSVLDPIFAQWHFTITSGFRTLGYNTSIGSSPTSDHCIGCAADIKIGTQSQNIPMFQWILQAGLPMTQVIFEGNWIHVAHNGRSPKGAARVMYTFTGTNPQLGGANGELLPPNLATTGVNIA